jgi:general L-amino acid transport system permease protein
MTYDRRWHAIALQALLLAVLAWAVWTLTANAVENLRRQNIASGFGFLSRTAGFDISESLIAYKNTDTYARAFWVGLCNTLLVAGLGIVLATALGFVIGIARLSTNWLIAKLALVYVEIVRNVPLLLWLFVMYFGVLLALPAPGASITLPFGVLLNKRGIYFPVPVMTAAWSVVAVLTAAGLVAAVVLWRGQAGKREGRATLWWALPLVPAVVLGLMAGPLQFVRPVMGPFNLDGAGEILPELIALLAGLVTYTAAYIGEIVRAGILSVSRGQRQAAAALGLDDRDTLRLVVIPQALRAIVPPLTNQYVNLAKNSSLAVAVGYPDLVSVFAGTILNHTNQAVETIAITMAVYLLLSLSISGAMNVLNARVALVER